MTPKRTRTQTTILRYPSRHTAGKNADPHCVPAPDDIQAINAPTSARPSAAQLVRVRSARR